MNEDLPSEVFASPTDVVTHSAAMSPSASMTASPLPLSTTKLVVETFQEPDGAFENSATNELDDAPWLSAAVAVPAAVTILSGSVLGFVIAFTPFFLVFSAQSADCAGLQGRVACESTAFAKCQWLAAGNGTCVFPSYERISCPTNLTRSECSALEGCVYDARSEKCAVSHGWSAAQTGIFAGFFVLGAIVAPIAFPPLVAALGARRTLMVMAVVIFVGAALTHVGRALESNFPLLVVSRVVFGVAIGIAFIVGNTYPREMAPIRKRDAIGALMSSSIPSAIAIFTIVAFLVRPTDFATRELKIEARIHGLVAFYWLLGVALLLLGLVMPESREWLRRRATAVIAFDHDAGEASPTSTAMPPRSAFWRESWRQMLVTVVIFAGQQMTGINALAVYAPDVAAGLTNVDPLVATLVFAVFAAVFAQIAPFVVGRANPRTLYIAGAAIAGCCLVAAGIAAHPGVGASETTRGVVVIVGILAFMVTYQVALGPAAFVTTVLVFDPLHLSTGMSFASTVLNIWSFLCTTLFPVLVQSISGGESADQNVGFAWTLMIFAMVGFASAGLALKFCHLHE